MEVSLGLLRDSQANQPDGMRASGRTSLRFSSEAVFDSRERSDSQLEVTVNNCSPSAHVLTSHPAESKDTVSTCALHRTLVSVCCTTCASTRILLLFAAPLVRSTHLSNPLSLMA